MNRGTRVYAFQKTTTRAMLLYCFLDNRLEIMLSPQGFVGNTYIVGAGRWYVEYETRTVGMQRKQVQCFCFD